MIRKMIRICLALDEDLKKNLEQEGKAKGLTLNAYIRMILIERGK